MSRPVLVGLVLVFAAGCASEYAVPGESVLRTDSAGIEVVTHTAPLDITSATEIRDEPVLVIESDEDGADGVLFQLTAVVPFGDGRLAVGSSGTGHVLVFDDAGRLERTLGGPGEGPGEFGRVSDVAVLAPDTVVVLDIRLGRLSVFAPSGDLARTVDVAGLLPPNRGAKLHAAEEGLWLVGLASLARGATPGVVRHSAFTYRLSAAGDSLAAYGPFPGSESVIADRLAGLLPFGSMLVSAVRGDRLVIGLENEPELLEFASPDRPARIIRWPDHDREVSPERAEAFYDFQADGLPPEIREQIGPALRAIPHSPTQPAYHGLVVSSDGVIWLGDYPGPEATSPEAVPQERTWTLIDADGVRRRTVRTPAGFTVMAVRDGLVYGVHRDELGVESVRVYAVPWPR